MDPVDPGELLSLDRSMPVHTAALWLPASLRLFWCIYSKEADSLLADRKRVPIHHPRWTMDHSPPSPTLGEALSRDSTAHGQDRGCS